MFKRKHRKTYNFSITINKELDNDKLIKYKLKFIHSFRFMSASLAILLDNLSEIYRSVSLKDLKITNFLITAKSVEKKQLKPINGLTKMFPNTYKWYWRVGFVIKKSNLSIWIHGSLGNI